MGAALIFMIILSSINKTGRGLAETITAAVFLGMMTAVIVFCFMMAGAAMGVQKAVRKQQREDRAAGISRFIRNVEYQFDLDENPMKGVLLYPKVFAVCQKCGTIIQK